LIQQLSGTIPLPAEVTIPKSAEDVRDLKSNLTELRDPLKLLRPVR
jgi:hypothetical protein